MNRIRPSQIAYADGARLLLETFDALLPPKRITVAEFAADNRWVKSPVGAHLERWDHSTAPYLTEPMEALTSGEHDTVAVVGPGACGKTMIAENWLLHGIAADPADLLWYMQTDPAKDAYVKGRIEPMLEAHDKLIGALRHGRDSVEFKRFRGMRAEFLAFNHNNLINKHVARIVADEIDAYDPGLGDPLALLNPRRQAAGADSMLLAISHPDLGVPIHLPPEQQRGIMALYSKSDRRTYWWPCPHCGGYSSPNPGTRSRMVLRYDARAPLDVIRESARMVCPHCDGEIANEERGGMRAAARWVGLGEEIDADGKVTGARRRMATAGFWIAGMMSPFVKDGIGGLAAAKVEAERALEASGDDASLRSVMVKTWGEPYQPPRTVGSVDAEALAERAEPDLVLGLVPEGVRFLTVSADTQGNRFEVLWRGWGVDGESWVIRHEAMVEADPATRPEDWLRLFELMTTPLPLADGSGRLMRPRCAVFDAYGAAGVTERAYEAWMAWRQRGLIQRNGRIDGRDAWTLLPSKGEQGAGGRLQVVYPDSRADRKAAGRGQVPVALFSTDYAKDALAGHLLRTMPGPGYVHFPAALIAASPDFYTQLTAEIRDRKGHWSKRSEGARNETLDLMVGTHVAARLHGLRRLNWQRPPSWAAEWDRNTLVFHPQQSEAPEPVAAMVQAPPAPAPAAPAPGLSGLVVAQAGARVITSQRPPARVRRYA